MNWQALPFIRLLAPFLAGICVADQCLEGEVPQGLPAALGGSLILLWIWHLRPLTFRRRHFFSFLLLLTLAGMGAVAVQCRHPLLNDRHFSKHWEASSCLAGVVWTIRPGAQRHRLQVEVLAIRSAGASWQPASGRLLVYLPAGPVAWGDTLLWRDTLRRIPPPHNPEAFDFARYMQRQGIFHQAFLRSGAYRVLPYRHKGWRLKEWAENIRKRGLNILQTHLPDEQSFGVAAALILGYRDALDEDLREAYAISGAMHILAVSGLHVGLVYLALSGLLRLLPRRGSRRRFIEMVIQLGGIWIFVLIAGLPASAVRAATMFSFFTLGRTLYRAASVYNILGASAFCMLLFDPLQLFQVGFQLSYCAVFGIVAWHRRIYRSWFPPNRLLDYGWKLSSVSLAAQLATFPLGIYYFNQFPLFFWLSGLIAVPAAGLILGGGLVLLLLEPIGPVADGAGWLLRHLLAAVNASIQWISKLPFSRLHGLWMEEWAVMLLYVFIAAVSLAVSGWALEGKRQGRLWLLALSAMLGLTASRAWNAWRQLDQQQVVVYHVPGHTLLDIIDGSNCQPVADSSLTPPKASYAAQRYRWSRRMSSKPQQSLSGNVGSSSWKYRSGLLQYYDWRLLVLGPETNPAYLPEMNLNAVLLHDDPDWVLSDLVGRITAGMIIVDASNATNTTEKWRRQCRKAGQKFFSVRDRGALVLDVRVEGIGNRE
jgi:competence protein ComEC